MPGYIISIIGGKGGVGKSVFAANFAHALALETSSKSCLVDLDLQAMGDQNHINGVPVQKTLYDFSKHAGPVNAKTIGMLLQRTPGGLYFCGLPQENAKIDDINPEDISRLLKATPGAFQHTVVDCGSSVNEYTARALEASTLIIVLTQPDILVVNQTRRIIEELQKMLFPKEMVQIVLNRNRPDASALLAGIQKTMGRNLYAAIPEEMETCMSALIRRQPFVKSATRQPITRAYHDLVRKLIKQAAFEKLSKLKKPTNIQVKSKKAGAESARYSTTTSSSGSAEVSNSPWTSIKLRIHKALVEQMNFKSMEREMENTEKGKAILREKTKKKVLEILNNEDTSRVIKSRDEMSQLVKEVLDEALALGPLEDLLADKAVTEIMVNSKDQIYIEKNGKPALSTTTFSSDVQLLNVIERIVAPLGRRIDEKTPYVDARLLDGSRVHAIIPPLALRGPTVTIRKFPSERLGAKDLVQFGSMTPEIADFLKICVESKLNIVIAGGTGSGKTTLLNVMSNFIPATDRIITIEDSAELQLGQEHLVRLETRPSNIEGEGAVTIRDLVKQTLRMRPDRIVVGECRGGEALDMLQAMNTGHDGSLTTVHANSPRDTLARLETLVMMAGMNLPTKAIREQIASAVHLIVQQSRLSDGSRKVTHITEITGMQGDVISMQDIFCFKQEGIGKKRKVIGRFVATGFVPKFVEDMEAKGIKIPRGLFTSGKAA